MQSHEHLEVNEYIDQAREICVARGTMCSVNVENIEWRKDAASSRSNELTHRTYLPYPWRLILRASIEITSENQRNMSQGTRRPIVIGRNRLSHLADAERSYER